MSDELKCPRCGGVEFRELDCGPDTYDDDITWTSQICESCGLYHSGWTGKWLVDCTAWSDEGDSKEYVPEEGTKEA